VDFGTKPVKGRRSKKEVEVSKIVKKKSI